MSEFDPIHAPKGRRFLRRLIIGAAVALGLLISMEWWLAAPQWRLVPAGGVSAVIGWLVARAVTGRR